MTSTFGLQSALKIQKVSKALQNFGFAPKDVPAAAFRLKNKVYVFGREPYRVVILTTPDAIYFNACYPKQVIFDLEGLRIPFFGLSDLKKNKTASGRHHDLADIDNLPLKKRETSSPKIDPPKKIVKHREKTGHPQLMAIQLSIWPIY